MNNCAWFKRWYYYTRAKTADVINLLSITWNERLKIYDTLWRQGGSERYNGKCPFQGSYALGQNERCYYEFVSKIWQLIFSYFCILLRQSLQMIFITFLSTWYNIFPSGLSLLSRIIYFGTCGPFQVQFSLRVQLLHHVLSVYFHINWVAPPVCHTPYNLYFILLYIL
jgi:hypothetical protein